VVQCVSSADYVCTHAPLDSGTTKSDVVDIFKMPGRTVTTAQLSQPRYKIQAESLPDLGLAIFAGGYSKY
jgi:hypothetical protein